MKKKPFVLAASIAALISNTASAQLQATGWLGDAADANWSSAGNWDNGTPGGNVRDLYFGLGFEGSPLGGNSLLSNNDLVGYQGHRITFESGTSTGFTIMGNGFTLFDFGGVFPRIQNDSTASQTFDLSLGEVLTLDGTNGGNKAEINAVNGNLIFSATTTIALAGDTQLQLGGTAGTATAFFGAITGAGTGGVRLDQAGTVTFSGGASNTYAGLTTAAAGTLRLEKTGGATAIAGDLTISGGTARWFEADQVSDSSAVTLTSGTLDLNGLSETIGSLNYQAGTLAFGGGQTLTLAGTGTALTVRNVTISNKLAFSGVTGGDVVFDATSNGTAVLGDVDFGATARLVTVANGTAATDLRVGGVISGQGFTKAGTGTMELTGTAANAATGLTQVNNGVLLLNKTGADAIGAGGLEITSNNTAGFGAATARLSAANQIDDSAPVTLSAAGGVAATLDINNFTETVGPLTVSSVTNGGAIVRLGPTGTLILSEDITLNNNRNASGNTGREVLITGTGSVATAGVGGTLDLGGGTRAITVNGVNQPNADATIEAAITNGSLVKKGNRVLRLGTVNSFAALEVQNGGVRALVDGAIPANVPLTVAGIAGATATLDFGGFDYTLTAANSLALGGPGTSVLATGAGTLTLGVPLGYSVASNPGTSIISGNLDLNGLQDTFNIGDSSGTTTELFISAVISGSTTGLRKTGAGTLAISGANTFTGPVIVEAGTLALRGQNTVSVSPQVEAGATLQFDAGLANNTEFNNILGAAGNGMSVDGGTIRAAMQTTGNVDRTLTNRLITVGAGGLTLEASGIYTNFSEGIFTQLRFAGASLSGSGSFTKTGGGRIQLQTTNPNFSGPVTVTDGTLEVSGGALGNASPTNTVTINGGNVAISGGMNQPIITMAGGGISANGNNQTIAAPSVVVTAPSYFFPNNFWSDTTASALGHSMTVQGVVSGGGDLLVGVNRPGYINNSGGLVLQNPANSYSGTITVGKNLFLTSSPAGGSGSALGTADVVLMNGKLNLRDNGAGSDGTLAYGNDVTATTPAGIGANGVAAGIATITADRSTGFNTGNTFQLGSLEVSVPQLDASGANGYGVSFAGLTTFTTSPIINVTGGVLTLAGGLEATGQTFTKTGAGTLRVLGTPNLAGYTVTGGVLEIAMEPAGAGRDLELPFGVGFSAGYAATQANLIDRVTLDSEGVIGLGVDSTFNPDFSAFINGPTNQRLRFGGTGSATLTGTITPWTDNVYRLGGGGGTLTLASTDAISGAGSLDVNTSGTAPGTIVLAAANNFTGAIDIGGGMTLRAGSNASLGTASIVSIDNGTLHLGNGGDFSAFSRSIAIGAGGASLNTDGNTVTPAELSNSTGTGAFTKLGAGTLVLNSDNPSLTGAMIIGGGTVSVQSAGALGATTAGTTVANGGTLALEGGVSTGLEQISINGVGDGSGGAIRNISGANTIGAIVSLQSAASIMSDAGTLTINVASGNATAGAFGLTIGGAGDIVIADPTAGQTSMTKVGTGTLRFTGDPNHTGLTTINGGTIDLANAGGSTDFNTIINDGGTLLVSVANKIGDGFDVTVNEGGTFNLQFDDTIDQLQGTGLVTAAGAAAARALSVNSSGGNSNFDGVIENGGAFALGLSKGNSVNTLTLTGANTYSGNTNVNQGTLRIEGNSGGVPNSNQFFLNRSNSILILGNNADTNPGVNRLRDAGEIEMQDGSQLIFNGSSDVLTPTTETFGNLEANTGHNIVTLNPAAGAQLELTSSSVTRSASGTFLIRGTNLGGTGADSSRLTFVTAPSGANFVGGGGAAGTTNQSIIPFIAGDTSTTGSGTSFVTHTAAGGVRPLAASEYASAIVDGTASTNNVSVAAAPASLAGRSSINALRLESGGSVALGAFGGLTVASGAIMDASATGGSITSGGIAFGAQPIVFHLAGASLATPINTVVSSNLASTGTLALSAANAESMLTLGGFNIITSEVQVNRGVLELDGPGALNPFVRNTLRFASEGITAASILRLNGHHVMEGTLAQHNGRVENGAATPATIGITQTSNADVNLFLQNGGTGVLNLVKEGGSRLSFNADSTFSGSATVRAGVLELKNQSDWDSVTSIIVEGGTFAIWNTDGGNAQNQNSNNDRLSNTVEIQMRGGLFNLNHNSNTGVSYSEVVGALQLEAGVNTVNATQHTSTTRSNSLVFNAGGDFANSLVRTQGAVVNFTGAGLGASTRSRIQIGPDGTGANPESVLLNDGILGGWATVGNEFATISGDLNGTAANVQHSITALATYDTGVETGWASASNVKTGSSVALTAGRSINSLVLGDGHDLDLGGFALNVDTGGVLAVHTAAAADKSIINGSLTAGSSNEIVLRVDNSSAASTVADLVLGANLLDNGNPVAFTKWGAGDVKLSGIGNDFSGALNVTQGTVIADSVLFLGAEAPGRLLRVGNTTLLNLGGSTADESLPFSGIEAVTIGQGTIRGAKNQTLTFDGSISGIGSVRLENAVSGTVSALNLRGNLIVGAQDTATILTAALPASSLTLASGNHSVGGTLTVGNDQRIATVTQIGGALSVGFEQVAPDLNIGYRTFGTGTGGGIAATKGVLDLTGTTNFTAQVANLRVGVQTGSGSNGSTEGDLIIGQDSHIRAGTEVLIGDSPGAGNTGVESSITFGSGTNVVETPKFTVGARKSTGRVTIASGGTLVLSGFVPGTADLLIGRNDVGPSGTVATGTFDVSAGTLIADLDEIVVAQKSTGTGTASSGGAVGTLTLGAANNVVTANSLVIGERLAIDTGAVTGVVNLAGGSFTVLGNVSAGLANGTTATANAASGTINVTGGLLSVGGDLILATRGTQGTANGTLNLSGGTVKVEGNITTTDSASANATVAVTGGALDLTGGTISADTYNFQSGSLRDVAQLFAGDGSTTADLVKSGAGTLTVEGANAYTGVTNVNDGTLLVAGALSGTSAVNIANQATLAGAGTINAAATLTVASGGTVSPGSSPGLLSTGSVDFALGSELFIEIGGNAAGTQYDQLNVTGGISLAGNLQGSLLNGFVPQVFDVFTIMLNDSLDGVFGEFANAVFDDAYSGTHKTVFLSGQPFLVSYTAEGGAFDAGVAGNDVALMAVPEPSSALALLTGLGAILGVRRSRRRRQA